MENCKVIAITNQKGGVGKTTTAVNLGVGLADSGRRNNFMVQNKRLISAVMALAMIFCLMTGCAAPGQETESTGAALEKIADNLYEISYTEDFDWGDAVVSADGGFSCSGVQNGQYRGRNYDWIYEDTDICVIHASVTDNRPHASVGVADLSFVEEDENTIYDLAAIPFKTVDGINDAGVCIQVNVMPYGENGTISHTETTDDDLKGNYIVRYVLDYAGSVEEALELLSERDIHSEWGEYEEFHWLLSGPTSETDDTIKTVVLEVFPDGLHITEDFVDDKPIISVNYSVFQSITQGQTVFVCIFGKIEIKALLMD